MPKKVMKNFSGEEERDIRKFIFTNPGGDFSFIYPQQLISGEELSPLMSAYSRSHIPIQERILKFLDQDKVEQTRSILPLIPKLIQTFRNEDGSLKMSTKTAIFNKLWPLKHGHSSIKEETALFGHAEYLSDITGKKITGHPLIKPQVKSTRYLSYGSTLDLSLKDSDISSLPEASKYFEHINWMNNRYLEMSKKLGDLVFNHEDTSKVAEFLRRPRNIEKTVISRFRERKEVDDNFNPSPKDYEIERKKVLRDLENPSIRKDIGKFVLDYSRNYLLAATKTSMGFSVDARTLEEITTGLISSPRQEDQNVGYSLWDEAKKISPILLGEKSHIHRDIWAIKNEKELRNYMQEKFSHLTSNISKNQRVTLLHPKNIDMYNDKFNAALTIFPYIDAPLLDIVKTLSESDVKEVLSKAHEHRQDHDILHPAISHGGLMFELTMGYHSYRDIFRHRRGSRSNQLLTTKLGFEIPTIFKDFNLAEEYSKDMEKCANIYEEVRKLDPHIAEKLVPFGANCRSLHSWQPNQVAYISKLRTNMTKGNTSYVEMAREMAQKVSEIMPETAKLFKTSNATYPSHLWKKGYDWYDQKGGNEI